jgi:sugar phosphate isomerase/epimerase
MRQGLIQQGLIQQGLIQQGLIRLGVFAKTFNRPSLESALDAVKEYGFTTMQFNFECAGLASMPDNIPEGLPEHIKQICLKRGLGIAAVSGTYNMIHLDPQERLKGLKRLETLASVCNVMGTSVITICTGSRDAENMWRHHPENNSSEAWRDLVAHLEKALELAERFNVTLGIEPEINNVINSAAKAKRLLDELPSQHLGIVLDAANLYQAGDLPDTKGILQGTFDLLGDQIIMAHAKDIKTNGEIVAAGHGDLDYPLYLRLLKQAEFSGALIAHGQSEAQTPEVVEFLRESVEKRK